MEFDEGRALAPPLIPSLAAGILAPLIVLIGAVALVVILWSLAHLNDGSTPPVALTRWLQPLPWSALTPGVAGVIAGVVLLSAVATLGALATRHQVSVTLACLTAVMAIGAMAAGIVYFGFQVNWGEAFELLKLSPFGIRGELFPAAWLLIATCALIFVVAFAAHMNSSTIVPVGTMAVLLCVGALVTLLGATLTNAGVGSGHYYGFLTSSYSSSPPSSSSPSTYGSVTTTTYRPSTTTTRRTSTTTTYRPPTTTTLPTRAPSGIDSSGALSGWVAALVSLDRDLPTERAMAELQEVRVAHPQAFLITSNDYQSLNPGYWVIVAGPFADSAGALSFCAQSGRQTPSSCYGAPLSQNTADRTVRAGF